MTLFNKDAQVDIVQPSMGFAYKTCSYLQY